MSGAALVAIAASIGNLLQGWDNATIAGAVLYIKKEFQLEDNPTVEGLIVAMSLIGATIITTFSGPVSDSVGRRPMMILSSILYFLSGLIMLWSPNVYVLLLAPRRRLRHRPGRHPRASVHLRDRSLGDQGPAEHAAAVQRVGWHVLVILHGVWDVTAAVA
jgi:hypothetical protein